MRPNISTKICKTCQFRTACKNGIPPPMGPCSFRNSKKDTLRELSQKVKNETGQILMLKKPVPVEIDGWTGKITHTIRSVRVMPACPELPIILDFGKGITARDLTENELKEVLNNS